MGNPLNRVIITFGLNALYGRYNVQRSFWAGKWNSTNTYDFIKYTISKGYQVKEPKSDFAAQLVSFIGSLINEVPSQAYWINEVAKYDFEGAGGYLVASVSGLSVPSPCYLESSYCLSVKQILHTKSAHRMFLGSIQTSVVGLSHRFHVPSDAGSQLKALSVFPGKCRENMHGTTEVILKRNTNIPADTNAVSVLVADLEKISEEGDDVYVRDAAMKFPFANTTIVKQRRSEATMQRRLATMWGSVALQQNNKVNKEREEELKGTIVVHI